MTALRLPLAEWNRRRSENERRAQALQRLYDRRTAVDDLIRALEHYQELAPMRQGECVTLDVAVKCS